MEKEVWRVRNKGVKAKPPRHATWGYAVREQ